jgi:hypothetical protein
LNTNGGKKQKNKKKSLGGHGVQSLVAIVRTFIHVVYPLSECTYSSAEDNEEYDPNFANQA